MIHELRELPVLHTARLTLRLAEAEDAAAILRYFVENREHLAPSRPAMDAEFFTEAFWQTQAHAARGEFRAGRSVRFFLWEQERVVGNANFTQIVRGAAQYCVLGYGIAADRQGLGLMREGLQAGIGYVFSDLKLHRVMANYVPSNQRSGALLRRLGFRVEGYARDYLFLEGAWRDHVLTALTNPDWQPDP